MMGDVQTGMAWEFGPFSGERGNAARGAVFGLGAARNRAQRSSPRLRTGHSIFFRLWRQAGQVFPVLMEKVRGRRTRFPDGRTLRTVTYQDPVTHLEVSREITFFPRATPLSGC